MPSPIKKRNAASGKINNTRRVKRTLDLIIFLNEWKSINECALHLDVDKRSIHRNFNMLIGFGLEIEVKHIYKNYYHISNIRDYFRL